MLGTPVLRLLVAACLVTFFWWHPPPGVEIKISPLAWISISAYFDELYYVLLCVDKCEGMYEVLLKMYSNLS